MQNHPLKQLETCDQSIWLDYIRRDLIAGGELTGLAKNAQGQTAVASAKTAYPIYKEIFGSDRFKRLENRGARAQRLLWASTGTKTRCTPFDKLMATLAQRSLPEQAMKYSRTA